ncbi:MAG: PASTA domain-containing protein, partial [Acidobacteriaceae bacterium]|nr:PASTA domain-containing protein [Acidobacteriaceae bacterium]
ILICVTVSGTTGEAGFGSAAAGPAFQSVAEAALRLREVPRDVPQEVEALAQKELEAKARLKPKQERSDTDEDDPVAQLSTPPTEQELLEAAGADADGPRVPDFTGKTVQDVMEEAAADGIDIQMLGNGLAKAQYPPAGAPLFEGEQIRVRFAR